MRRGLISSISVVVFCLGIAPGFAGQRSTPRQAGEWAAAERDRVSSPGDSPIFSRIIRYIKRILHSTEGQISIPKP
ncbi:MAG: hypothetical protein JWO56_13 [Acidobacteria bacterium]|jgi:hypothetical protein|nr:hypothetical protein [Acidobacteriota bacterium]